jgi:LPXTG-motif cell wall-anchored protein
LFESYGDGKVVMPGVEPRTVIQAGAALAGAAALIGAGLWVLGKKTKK